MIVKKGYRTAVAFFFFGLDQRAALMPAAVPE